MLEVVFNLISASIVEFTILFFCKKLSNKKGQYDLLNKIVLVLMPVLQIINYFFKIQIFNPIITIALVVFVCRRIFNCRKDECIKYTIIIWSLSVVIDILMMLIVNGIDISKMNETQTVIMKSISSILMSVILLIIAKNTKFISFAKKICNKMTSIKINYNVILLIIE